MSPPPNSDSPERAATTAARIVAFTAALGAITFALFWQVLRPLGAPTAPFHISWWFLAVLFALAELCVINLEWKRQSYAVTTFEIVLVLGLFYASPATLLVAVATGTGVALLSGRQRPLKLAFNVVTYGFEACVGILVYRSLAGATELIGPRNWIAAYAAALTVSLLGAACVTLVMAMSRERVDLRYIQRMVATTVVAVVVNGGVALVAVAALWSDVRISLLLIAVAGVFVVVYRAYSSLNSRHESLGLLYEFTRAVGPTSGGGEVIRALLAEAARTLRSEGATLTVFDERSLTESTLVAGELTTKVLDSLDALQRRVLENRDVLVVSRSERDPQLRDALQAKGLRDAVVAPLRSDTGVIGTLTVHNRLAEAATFLVEDGRLLETIANHASVWLEKGRLNDRLRHDALHDSLTGLPNRSQLELRIDDVIGAGEPLALLVLDCDRFKDVNDSLGHHTGDLLLREVSERLSEVVPAGTLARLGGDEFAVLVRGESTAEGAVAAAQAIQEALREPFVHGDVSLDVAVSVGVALAPAHGSTATAVLQRADSAMYAAKKSITRVVVYSPELDDSGVERLALVGDLRRAIDGDDLALHFQPKIATADRRVVGVEALVRWVHPERGFVPPDEFIPVAENTGLIAPLTSYVLRHALQQCRFWLDLGLVVPVAVNLSARSLADADLPDMVRTVLQQTGVPATHLTLEITETSVMTDTERTIDILDRLSAMGIGLSIDDFGTGYSSLSYLKRLPVQEVKIDKSFVLNMGNDENDAMIVRSIVDLGRNLGLSVVAEGVEDEETLVHLTSMGCERAQGYHISRPVPAGQLTAWLLDREREAASV